jgi:folate-dependent phosphoribosylglycinamide formyltransferase PurN
MLPDKYPLPQPKTETVIAAQQALGYSKTQQEGIADIVAASSDSPVARQFAKAIAKSSRRMAEDIFRESGYMLPQSAETRELLEAMKKTAAPDFPKEAVDLLLNQLQAAG